MVDNADNLRRLEELLAVSMIPRPAQTQTEPEPLVLLLEGRFRVTIEELAATETSVTDAVTSYNARTSTPST